MNFNPDHFLNFERRTGVRDADIDEFNNKADSVQKAIRDMIDGKIDPKDVKIEGIDTEEEKAAKEAARLERIKKQKEKDEKLRLERKAAEREKWWNAVEVLKPKPDDDCYEERATVSEQELTALELEKKQARYNFDYSRWDTWTPDDEATREEAAEEEKRQEDAKNKEFEKNNAEFCNEFLEDMEKRKENQQKKAASAEANRLKGNKYFKSKDFDRAIECYMEALKEGQFDVKTLTNIAQVHIKTKNYDDAMDFLSRTLYLDPDHVKALSRKALIESERGMFEEADKSIKRALSLDPSNIDVANQAREISIIVKEKRDEAMIAEAKNASGDCASCVDAFKKLYEEHLKRLVDNNTQVSMEMGCEFVEKFLPKIKESSKHLDDITKELVMCSICKTIDPSGEMMRSTTGDQNENKDIKVEQNMSNRTVAIQLLLRNELLDNLLHFTKYLVTQRITVGYESFGPELQSILVISMRLVVASIEENRASKLLVLEAKLISAIKPLLKVVEMENIELLQAVVTLMHTCCKDDFCVKSRHAICSDKSIFVELSSIVGNFSFTKIYPTTTIANCLLKAAGKKKDPSSLLDVTVKDTIISVISLASQIIKVIVFSTIKTSLVAETSSVVCALATLLHVYFCSTDGIYTHQLAKEKEVVVEALLGLSQEECMRSMFAIALPFETEKKISAVSVLISHINSWDAKPTARMNEPCRVSIHNCLATLMNACLPTAQNSGPLTVVEEVVNAGVLDICCEELKISEADRRLRDPSLLARKAGLLSRLIAVPVTQKKLSEIVYYRAICRRIAPLPMVKQNSLSVEEKGNEKAKNDEQSHYIRILAALGNQSDSCKQVAVQENLIQNLLLIFPTPRKDAGEVTPETVTRMPENMTSQIIIGNAARCLMNFTEEPKAQMILFQDDSFLGVQKLICAMASCNDIRVRRNISIILAKGCRLPGVREKVTKFRGLEMMRELQDKL